MKRKIAAIFLVMCSLVIMSAAVYADLKKGYYLPAELGSVRQAIRRYGFTATPWGAEVNKEQNFWSGDS